MKKKRLTLASLEKLISELEGIQSLLPDAYASYGDDEDDDATFELGKIDSSEVEVALSAAVAELTSECDLEEEPESLSGLLAEVLKEGDDAVRIASDLEDAVNGYFGELFGENLELANDLLKELVDNLKEKSGKWKEKINSRQLFSNE